jgi:HK97 gp10 family phage protein
MANLGALSIKVEGLKKLENQLKAMENKIGKKIVRSALRKAAKPIQAAAKANATAMIGGDMGSKVSRAIVVRAARARRFKYGVGVQTNPKRTEELRSGEFYIPAAIEYGHAYPGRGGTKSKDVPAVPFMREAIMATKGQAMSVLRAALTKGINSVSKES